MKNKNKISDENNELKYLVATSQVKELIDPATKAAFIVLNYIGELKLSKRSIARYFNISRNLLKKRIWSMLCGHTTHDKNKSRYLAPCYEEELASMIDERNKNLRSATIEEVKTMVPLFHIIILIHFIRHMI